MAERPGSKLSLDARTEALAKVVVDAAYQVHRALGPGLLEHVYEICLQLELERRGLRVKRQVQLAINYAGVKIHKAYVIDLLVEDCIVIELKAIEQLTPKHSAQLLTYLKLSGKRLGFLINFNEAVFTDGFKRKVL